MNPIATSATLANTTIAGVRLIDLAAFAGLALVWVFVFIMLYGIYKVLRSKARGDAGWGDSPGL
jgi:hypothetical protein